MAKRAKIQVQEAKSWREAELINAFKLTRIVTRQTLLMQEWFDVQTPELTAGE